MATTATATLNGGPTGGLHATTLLHTSEQQSHNNNNTQQQLQHNLHQGHDPNNDPDNDLDHPPCHGDSNSSFDSGHEDSRLPPSEGHWPPYAQGQSQGQGHPKIPSISSYDREMDTSPDNTYISGGNKKRRKQSRPVRIPASEFGLLDTDNNPPQQQQQLQQQLQQRKSQEFTYEEMEESSKGMGKNRSVRSRRGHQGPLNLSSSKISDENEDNNDSDDNNDDEGLLGRQLSQQQQQQFHMQFQMQQLAAAAAAHANDSKTDLCAAASGTKDLQRSNLNPSFSPALFPLISSSPFFSFFPQAPSTPQGTATSNPNNPPGSNTPTSNSSAGSNNPQGYVQQQQQHSSGNTISGGSINPSGGGTSSGGGGLQNIPPHRIFNPEAYCDLCNKEFCNKYFLKTHKANKHGVYSDGPITSVSSLPPSQVMAAAAAALSISSPSSVSSQFLSATPANMICAAMPHPLQQPLQQQLQQQQQQIQQIQQSQQQQQQQSPVATTTTAMGGISAPNTPLGASPSLNIKSEGSVPLPLSLALSLESKGGGNSNGSQTKESFCDLCQKEFCNKYFLKRHRAKIHGIAMEGGGGSSGGNSNSATTPATVRPSGGSSKGSRPPTSFNGIGDKAGLPLMIGSELESLGLELVAKHIEESSGGVEEGEVGHNSNGSGIHNIRANSSPEGISKQNMQQQLQMPLPLSLPQLGVGLTMTENTCQFCLREFSTKSLLRTHMTKKHRLLLPTFPPFLLPFQAMGTHIFEEGHHPLDGTDKGEELGDPDNENDNENENDHEGSPYEDALNPPGANNNNKAEQQGAEQEPDYECNQCHRSFQTIYLLRMHKSYFHPESHSDDMADITAAAAEAVTKMEENSDGESGGERSPTQPQSNPLQNQSITNPGPNSEGEDADMLEDNEEEDLEEEEELEAETTSDSDDLRRLQTMIMELNRVSSAAAAAAAASWSPPPVGVGEGGALGGGRSQRSSPAIGGGAGINIQSNSSASICPICSKEFYSTYFLQQHIQHYHADIKSESPDTAIGTGNLSSKKLNDLYENSTSSTSSQGQGQSQHQSQGQHSKGDKLEIKMPSDMTAGLSSSFLTPGPKPGGGSGGGSISGAGGLSLSSASKAAAAEAAKRPSPSLSRSYCTICHKELCNKYFMRTHMLKMHGISIESSTGLGGVTCDICNKELCSKYFLKVHKQNTHGIVEDGPSPPNPSTPGPQIPLSLTPSSTSVSLSEDRPSLSSLNNSLSLATINASSGSDLVPLLANSQVDLQNRYYCHYSEVCPFCGRRFRSAKWLKTHLMTDHGQEGKDRWKAIEKTLQHHSSRSRGSKSGGGSSGGGNSGGGVGSGSANSKSGKSSSQKPSGQKSSQHTLSGGGSGIGGLPITSNGSNGNKCALCGFTAQDMEVMKVHLIKEHASQLADPLGGQILAATGSNLSYGDSQRGATMLDPLSLLFQKMEGGSNKLYRCAYCPFTTSLLVYLYAHERTHTGLANPLAPPQNQQSPQNQQLQQLQQSQQQSRQTPPTNSSSESATPGGGANTFQCPMCFHSLPTVESFQQHLISHQMSGVLAPFFTPPVSSASSRSMNLLPFLPPTSESSTGGDGGHAPFSALALPVLNGALGTSGDSLYWALKQSAANSAALESARAGLNHQGQVNDPDYDENSSPSPRHIIKTEPGVEDLTMPNCISSSRRKLEEIEECQRGKNRRKKLQKQSHLIENQPLYNKNYCENETEAESEETLLLMAAAAAAEKLKVKERESNSESKKRKVGKISSFRCSYCNMTFKTREEASTHIQQTHQNDRHGGASGGGDSSRGGGGSVRRNPTRTNNKNFRCRKCKFQSSQYQKLVVHNRVHHSTILRGGYHSESGKVEDGALAGVSRLMSSWNKFTDNENEMLTGSKSLRPKQLQLQRQCLEGQSLRKWNNMELESLPQGRAVPQQGVLGNYLMQGFLLSCSSDEDKFDTTTNQSLTESTAMTPPAPTTFTLSQKASKTSQNQKDDDNHQNQMQIQIQGFSLPNPDNNNSNGDAAATSEQMVPSTFDESQSQSDKRVGSQSQSEATVEGFQGDGNGESVSTEGVKVGGDGKCSVGSSSTESMSTMKSTTLKGKSSPCAKSVQQSSGLFVPSLVYLPVREKVSQSVRVSFSLTPTS